MIAKRYRSIATWPLKGCAARCEPAAVLEGATVVLDSITELGATSPGCVVVSGSHGGVFPARYAAHRRVASAIFNDAGIGRDGAGVAGLAVLDGVGVPAATVDHRSARIGDGQDTLTRGRLSVVNHHGQLAGWEAGLPASEAVELALGWPVDAYEAPSPLAEARELVASEPVTVWALDSASLAGPGDAGCVLATGSHGGLLGGRPETALRADALAALFNDAGGGAGTGRLRALDDRGISAATVSADSARIGDGRSTYRDGIVSAVNASARALGAAPGMSARAFVEAVAAGVRA
jgi:hypothetical protein